MGIAGWTDTAHDLRDERPTLNALAAALSPTPGADGLTRPGRHIAVARRGAQTGYADWRHPGRHEPDLVVLLDGYLSNRERVEEQLYQRSRPLTSDAELLVHAYRQWSAALVDRIDGAYAIVIWDERSRQLLLIRDPIGAKTLFYARRRGGLVFGSQGTALLAHPGVTASIDAEGLNELLTLGPVRTPGSAVIRGVRELMPGQLLRAAPTGMRLHQYWSLQADEHGHDLDDTVRFLRQTLVEKTAPLRRRPGGAVLLSGGIGSSVAAALATPAEDNRPAGYSLTLATPGSPPPGIGADVSAAARTASDLQLDYTVITRGADGMLDAAAATRRILDFPGPTGVDAPLWTLLSYAAAEGHTSVVSGEGAAAVGASYPWLHDDQALSHEELPWQPRGLSPADLLNDDARWYMLPDIYRKQRFIDGTADIGHIDGEDVFARRRRIMAHLTVSHYLPSVLARLDQFAAAAGVTVHTPFADWRLAQYLYTTPFPLRHLFAVPNGLLHHTVADLVPPDVTWRTQEPIVAAHRLPGWAQTQRERLLGIIDNTAAPLHTLLDRSRVRYLLKQSATEPGIGWHSTVDYLIEVNAWLGRHRVTVV